jgi:hypothetical protein
MAKEMRKVMLAKFSSETGESLVLFFKNVQPCIIN